MNGLNSREMDNNTIMIQGTASNVGKSVLTTALCRIFANKGYRVSPFKSWNMSLNSWVTSSGGEIGIAQAIQALATSQKPTVDMQPILVKPKGDGISQIIVRGTPVGDKTYQQQDYNYINWAMGIIKESLFHLKNSNDLVILEGAGSPVEINVRDRDLANMKVAKLFNTPVLLVADIDRGGALASLVGTLKLMQPGERRLVKGLIINRFRGDIELLKPGIEILEDYTGVRVLGVIPYLKDILIPEEDSVSLKKINKPLTNNQVQIGVIRLPHISNFTDFDSLAAEVDVNLAYIDSANELNDKDLIIIPGTKSTTMDLEYLKKSGLAEGIKKSAIAGIPVIGICGGFQMMGQNLLDPHHTEGKIGQIKGLEILPVETEFLSTKTTHQVNAKITDKGKLLSSLANNTIEGYEIHMGVTRYLTENGIPFRIVERSGEKLDRYMVDGAVDGSGLSFGTYLHGLFNNDKLRRSMINKLREMKDLPIFNGSDYNYWQELDNNLDRLADKVSSSLDIDYIYDLFRLSG